MTRVIGGGGLGQIQGRSDSDGLGGDGGGVVLGDRFDPHQRGAGLDLAAGHHQQLLDPAREGRADHGLHLHRLQHDDRCSCVNLVADLGGSRHHERRRGRPQYAALIATDSVSHPVDLDQVYGAVRRRHEPEALALDRQPAMEVIEPLDDGLDGALLGTGGDRDAIARRTDLHHADLVRRTTQLQVDGATHLVLHLRTAAERRVEESGDLDGLLVFVRLDGRGDQGSTGVSFRDQSSLGPNPVDPTGVGPRTRPDHLGLVQQFEDETLVGGTTLDDHAWSRPSLDAAWREPHRGWRRTR